MAWKPPSRVAGLILAASLWTAGPLQAAVLRVPADFPTIKSAVDHAADGDSVIVDDGTYLEKNIVVSKRILVKSQNLYGALIYGSKRGRDAVFLVRAAARIEGFIIKGGGAGILQRDSPDVPWQASDLVIMDCQTGIAVDDAEANVGSALIRNVAIFGSDRSVGIAANDANSVDASGCLIVNCVDALDAYDHLSFRINDSAILDCGDLSHADTEHRPIPPATSRIAVGPGVRAFDSRNLKDPRRLRDFLSFLRASVLRQGPGKGPAGRDAAAVEAVIALTRSWIMEALSDHSGASSSFANLRSAGERIGSREFVWLAMTGAARAEASRGAFDKARDRYGEAVDFLERWVPQVPVGIYRLNFLADKVPVFEAAIGLLIDRHAAGGPDGYDEEAFFYSERLKSLSRLFSSKPNGHGAELDARAAGEKSIARKNIAAIQLALQNPDLSARDKERLIDSLEQAEERFHAALIGEERSAAVAKTGSTAGEEVLPSPLTYRALRERLGGRAAVSYVLGEKRSFAFLATESGLSCIVLPPADEIGEKVKAYLRFLQLADGGDFKGGVAGKILFEALVGAFKDRLALLPRRIIIVPGGQLRYLPFEALVPGPAGDARPARFWGESVTTSYAASVTQALAGGRGGAAGGPRESVLAVGSSNGIRCDNRGTNLKQFFFPLVHVRKEIKALARFFPDRNVTVLLDREATEGRFKAECRIPFDIIHIAAHGVIDDESWWRSALLLTPEAGRAEDGFLTALEISELDLRARLVVLSGCGTGAGSLFNGDGIKGLSEAFMRAGAEHVLVSLWSVDDRATSVFMSRFYERLAAADPPAEALAAAKAGMIAAGYRNPFYWAPFVLIGRAEDRRGEGQ